MAFTYLFGAYLAFWTGFKREQSDFETSRPFARAGTGPDDLAGRSV